MLPEEFIARWRGTTRTERSAAQEHFLDLCALLGVPKPADVDPHDAEYTFEKSTRNIDDSAGFAEYLHIASAANWDFAAEEARSPEAMVAQGYRGSRYSFGYPACPDLADQKLLLALLCG
jgi:Vitamin B12 dependent methionine synthase, activation domain